jgi:predicted enzyme related to lactoylglutathione lyase
MERFTHFEFATSDREKTAAFYRAVFGWQIHKWEGPVDYWLVNTGDQSTLGLNGGLMQAGGDFSGTVNTVGVEDIDATLAKVKANGGAIISEKQPIPGVGQLAYFKDNCGIVVGVLQPDPNSSM